MNKFPIVSLILVLAIGLVACAPSGDGTEAAVNPTEEAAEPTEASEPTAESSENEEGEAAMREVTYYVGPVQVDCTGVAPQKCLLVREDPNADYQFFYSTINGFEFVEGFEYELLVQVEEVENPPADASALNYTLIEVVNQSRALEGNVWALESWRNEEGEMVPAIADSGASAEFRAGQLSGNGGCNSFSGGYERNGNELTVSPIASTLMLCTPEELGTQETAYLAHLQNAATYQITDDRLEISNSEGEVTLTFTLLEPAPLTGTTWTLVSYNNGRDAITGLLADTEVTVVFGEDGRLNGVAGCNNYMTSYTVEGNSLTIQPPASTRKLCPDEGVMEQEAAFLMGLETVTTYTIRGGQLELRDGSGSLIASFTEAEG